jgi:SM-20-related protein
MTHPEQPIFRLDPDIDAAALRERFARDQRVRIQPFLDHDTAVALHAHLRAREDWKQVVNSGDKVFELDRAVRAAMSVDQLAALDEAVRLGARTGFQYRYESLRLNDGTVEPDAVSGEEASPIAGFTRWMSTDPVRALVRTVTQCGDIAYADGQATAYAPGDFLTGHDDAVAGKQRRAAYVFGLTPTWRVEWGGLLLFHGPDGAVDGVAPGFNSIDLFAVPQPHSVSLVTPSAAYRRYAITGWMRARDGRGS